MKRFIDLTTLFLLAFLVVTPSLVLAEDRSTDNMEIIPEKIRAVGSSEKDQFSIASDLNDAISQYAMAEPDKGANSENYLSRDDEWEFTIVPYAWLSSISGDVAVGGTSTEVDTKFSDLLKVLDFGAQVHIEARRNNFGIFIDPTYIKLSVDDNVPLGNGVEVDDVTFKEFLLELAAFYRLGRWHIGSPYNSFVQRAKPSLTLDTLAGGRYINMDLEIDLDGTPSGAPSGVSGDKNWLDLFVGGRAILNITEKLSFVLRSDIGGFGFGFSSDITWNLISWLGYELPWYRITPVIGYRVLYIDYDDGSGDSRFVNKTWTYGPLIGLAFRF